MVLVKVLHGRGELEFSIPRRNLVGVFESSINRIAVPGDGEAVVRSALASPIGGVGLSELAAKARKIVLIASDHTRPVPSKQIVPAMLEEIRRGNPEAEITILIATGMHRGTTRGELIEKFGEEIVSREKIVVHDARDEGSMAYLGILPSGGELWINKLAVEADLLVSEGFIEPHFFAGFSGGRKSVLPGIAGYRTVLANHCGEFIRSASSRTGVLEGNPIHKDMVWAAGAAKLAFVVNVVINSSKRVMGAFAGEPFETHARGCEYLKKLCQVQVPISDIVITSNGGYPLDQNVYQAVKGMTAAEACVRDGGVIVMSAECEQGHGGESFFKLLSECKSHQELYRRLGAVPQAETEADQWEAQILARILSRNRVIMVGPKCDGGMLEAMGLMHVATAEEAMRTAFSLVGEDGRVAVLPDGVSLIVEGVSR
ncbi:MAG: nickel-dependent lactate racemase [Lentisphaerae bacterium]|jgi:nickel-dependent lactate racemase|nr:nickel-dependent lactate racemase [Lentisphaerota bacterium]